MADKAVPAPKPAIVVDQDDIFWASPSRPILCCSPGLTKQEFRDQCDINSVVAQYLRTGVVQNVNPRDPFYGDVSEVVDFGSAFEVVKKAESMFAALPYEVRDRFENDPAQFIAFFADSKNLGEAVKLGLAVKRPEEPVDTAKPVVVAPAPVSEKK